MKLFTQAILAFFCLEIGIISAENEKWTYIFNASSTFGDFYRSTGRSQWSLSGKLIIYSFENYKIMKLEDLQTRSFNGHSSGNIPAKWQSILKEAQPLLEPFLVNYYPKSNKIKLLGFEPGHPKWSVNMKRGFANMFQLNFDKELPIKHEKNEVNLFGNCTVYFRYKKENGKTTATKDYVHKECSYDKMPTKGVYYGKTNRKYTFHGESILDGPPNVVETSSVYSYHRLLYNSADKTQKMEQNMVLELQSVEVDNTEFNTNEYTLEVDLPYEPEDKAEDNPVDKNAKEVWMTQINELHKILEHNYVHASKQLDFNVINNIFDTLSSMDYDTLNSFLPSSFNMFDPYKMFSPNVSDCKPSEYDPPASNSTEANLLDSNSSTSASEESNSSMTDSSTCNSTTENFRLPKKRSSEFISSQLFEAMLPYIGSSDSVRVLKNLATRNSYINLDGLIALITFPFNVKDTTEEMVKDMEVVLLFNETDSIFAKDISTLSLANLVRNLYSKVDWKNDECPYKKIIKNYVDIYCSSAKDSKDPEEKVQYILGLGNMHTISEDCLTSFVINAEESTRIRTLALYALKTRMSSSENGAFEFLWPIVKNKNEPFELRAAALHVLLQAKIDKSQLYAVFDYMNQTSDDPTEKHLYNDFYTSLEATKNKAFDLGKFPYFKPVASQKNLMTGYYSIRTMDIFGTTFDTIELRVVADPVTNFVETLQIECEDGHSIYINVKGLPSLFPPNFVYTDVPTIYQDLKRQFKLQGQSSKTILNLDVVVYYSGQAIFALNWNENIMRKLFYFLEEALPYFLYNDLFGRSTYKTQIPSEIGSPISLGITEQVYIDKFVKEYYPNIQILAKSLWQRVQSIESYNPLLNINHGISSNDNRDYSLKVLCDVLWWEPSIKWVNEDQNLESLEDHTYELYVDKKETIKESCSSCQSPYEVYSSPSLYTCEFKDRLKDVLGFAIDGTFISNWAFSILNPLILAQHVIKTAVNKPKDGTCRTYTNLTHLLHSYEYWNKITLENYDWDPYTFPLAVNMSVTWEMFNTTNNNLVDTLYFNFTNPKDAYNSTKLNLYNTNKDFVFNITSEAKSNPSGAEIINPMHLEPATPTTITTSFYFNTSVPGSEEAFNVITHFSVSDRILGYENYKTCLQEKRDLNLPPNYTPPTLACYKTSKFMSTYDNILLLFEFEKSHRVQKWFADYARMSLRENQLGNTISFHYSAFNLENINVIANSREHEVKFPFGLRSTFTMRPKYKFLQYFRQDVLGYYSTCYITANTVKTFTEETVKIDKVSTMLALLDCRDYSKFAMLTGRNKSQVYFKLWEDNLIFESELDNNYYKIKINKNETDQYTSRPVYEIMQTEDSAITRIKTRRMELIYDGYSLGIVHNSARNQDTCGICSTGVITAPNEATAKYFKEKLENPEVIIMKITNDNEIV